MELTTEQQQAKERAIEILGRRDYLAWMKVNAALRRALHNARPNASQTEVMKAALYDLAQEAIGSDDSYMPRQRGSTTDQA